MTTDEEAASEIMKIAMELIDRLGVGPDWTITVADESSAAAERAFLDLLSALGVKGGE